MISLPLVHKGRWYAKHTGGDQNFRNLQLTTPQSRFASQLPFTGEPIDNTAGLGILSKTALWFLQNLCKPTEVPKLP